VASYPTEFVECQYRRCCHREPTNGAATIGNLSFVAIVLVLLALFQPFGVSSPRPTHVSLPIVFETNMGQAPPAYRFVSRHGTVGTLFSSSGVDMFLPEGAHGQARIGFRLLGARPDVLPVGKDLLPSVSHYLLGSDPSIWIHGVPNHSQIIYPEIYPGIDLIFRGSGDNLEHDFRISPGADPARLRFSIVGAHTITLSTSGDLNVSLRSGTLVFRKPLAYQDSAHGRETVESSFVLNSDDTVQFRLGSYDRNHELVIDPVFSFSTYLAGSTADNTAAVASDSSGNIYVTGYTYSSDFPIENGLQPTYNGSPDAFVSKLDPTGHSLLYSTYLGGSSRNYGNAIAVDSKGNIIVGGTSSSNDFPHVGSVPALTCEGNNDCFFLASLKPDGSAFNYAGLIGGIEGTAVATGQSGGGILALDTAGNAYLASVTDDAHFEITPGTLASTVPGYPYNSTFVLKADSTGALVYSTIVLGTAPPNLAVYLNDVFVPAGISVDANGQATIAGTSGPGLPSTAGVIQPTFPNNLNVQNASAGFVLQLNAKASAINYATYVPGTDVVGGLATDSAGDSYLTGGTSETNLPVSSNAYQKTLKTGQNCTCNSGFLLELDGVGKNVLAATYLEGTPAIGNEGTAFTGIALDSHSNVYVGGMTGSTDFPLQDPFISIWEYSETASEMVLAEMSPDLSALLFGSFLSSTDQVYAGSTFSALTVDHQDNLIVTGETSTTDFPTTPGAFQTVPPTQARHDFVSKFNMASPAPSVCLDTWYVNFALVPAKKSSTQTVHLTNCGNAALNLASLVSSAATVKATETCGTIEPGSVCPISVTFSPVDSSPVAGTVTLNDNTAISPQVFSFSGQGSAPQLSPSSGSFNFGHLLVNTTGAGNGLFFSNAGNAPLTISSVSVDGDFSITQDSCKGTISPNNFCVISVVFSPSAAGIRTGTLFIVSNDPVHRKAGLSLEGVGDTVYAVPVIAYLSSPTVQIKNGAITVGVSGANFYPASVIEVNGKPQPTAYSSGEQLQATLNSDVTNAIGQISVTVFNPAPGGGASVEVPLTRYAVVNVDAAFLTTVPGSTFLYASIPSDAPTNANTVIPINPVSGALGKPIPVGQNPGPLAASSDGSYLFVVLNQDQTVQRINLSTNAVDRTFPFPPNGTNCCGALSGTDLKGVPGMPQEVVLALDIPLYGFGEMALYNDSGLVNYVPTTSVATVSFSSFAYVGNPVTIYSLPFTNAQNPFFNIVTINSQGLQFTPYEGGNYGGNNTVGTQVVSDGTLLYTNSGEVWSPATQTQVGTFPVTAYYDTLYNLNMDLPSGHIFLVDFQPYGSDSASIVLSAYGQKSLGLTGSLAFPQVPVPIVECLVRWGSNGFAFLGQGSTPYVQAVYLLTSSLASPLKANAVPQLKSVDPSSVSAGNQGFQLTLNGQGFTEAAVVNWNGTPLQTTYVASTVLTAMVGASDLTNSGAASITVTNPAPGGGTSHPIQFTISPLAPLISFSSSALTFPAQSVGTASLAQKVAVQNPGTALLTISRIAVTGANAGSFYETNNCGKSLAPGTNCLISVVFKPVSTGSLAASVSVTDNANGSPQTISLTGTGR
jgi:Beta-propeller repeat/Abnormal spindle-like microcephaly-assoc'd, ASPM-SPD-2-Hydin